MYHFSTRPISTCNFFTATTRKSKFSFFEKQSISRSSPYKRLKFCPIDITTRSTPVPKNEITYPLSRPHFGLYTQMHRFLPATFACAASFESQTRFAAAARCCCWSRRRCWRVPSWAPDAAPAGCSAWRSWGPSASSCPRGRRPCGTGSLSPRISRGSLGQLGCTSRAGRPSRSRRRGPALCALGIRDSFNKT